MRSTALHTSRMDSACRRRVYLALLATFLFVCRAAVGQPIASPDYRVDHFTSDQGLPGHQIYDIDQTADGYLWVTTNNAIARFDGYSFSTFPTSATSRPVGHRFANLHLASGDTLFASTTMGYVVRYANGSFSSPDLESTFGVEQLARDRSGHWWATNHLDLLSADRGRLEILAKDVLASRTRNLFVDAAGDPWIVTRRSRLFPAGAEKTDAFTESDEYLLVRLEEGRPKVEGATLFPFNVTLPSRGEILFSRRRGSAVEFHNNSGEVRGTYTLNDSAQPLLIDRLGYLWVDEAGSLQSYAPGAAVPNARIPVPGGGIRAWFEDREGNLWVGTALDGLLRIRRNPFGVVTAPGETQVLSMTQGTGGSLLAVFAMSNEAYRIQNGGVTRFMSDVLGLYEAPEGHALFHQIADEPIPPNPIIRRMDGRERVIGQAMGHVLYQQIYPDPTDPDVVWTHDAQAVYRIADPFGESPTQTTVVGELYDVRHMLRTRAGHLWVATGDGLIRLTGEEVTRFAVADGLPSNHLRAVLEDEDGTLWVGSYGYGLVRYRDGEFRTVTTREGLGEDVVSSILSDDQGNLWMSGNRGVHRASRADLNAFLDGRLDRVSSVLYGRESGLLNPEASGFAGLKGNDGRLWFPTFHGAAFVDPAAAMALDDQAPLVHVTSVIVDKSVHPTNEIIRLDASQRRFEITYVGVSLRDPEGVTYRYRLDGFDDGWIDAGTARSAVYTNVTAGMHTFHVQGRSFGGVWSDVDSTLRLHVAQVFYKTWWFNLLLGFGLLGLAALLYRRRVQTLESRQRYLHALVEERTKELVNEKEIVAAQANELRSLDRTKSRFFANVSHEFRTPLTLILGPLEDVQDGRLGPLDEGVRRHVGTAIRNGRRMLRLVNQLLDISRLESGWQELKAQECDLGRYVERAVQAFASLAERKRIELRFERPAEPVLVYVDVEQFEKVIANLVGNALKFTPEGGAVFVSLELESDDSHDERRALLRVSDNGPGIPPDHLPHVFERFYQVDASSTRRQPGTGIGLALVVSLVELHHGTVEVESTFGFGTTFTVRLRLGDSHLQPGEIADSSFETSAPRFTQAEILDDTEFKGLSDPESDAISSDENLTTVLVVDDNADVRHYIRGHLAPRFRVLEAADGRDALRQARAFTPDLVLTDIMMPEMNGYDLCRAIRRDPDLAFIPIILLTARESTENRLIGLEEGADDYISKPFNVRELEIRVENLLASRQRLKASFLGDGASLIAAASTGEGAVRSDTASLKSESFIALARAVVAAKLSDDDFGVAALAAALGVGRSSLYTRLSEVLGTTPMDLIWRMRLERAASMLRSADSSVSEVAYGVGFKSVGHFCRRFRMEFGCSPTEYTARQADAAD